MMVVRTPCLEDIPERLAVAQSVALALEAATAAADREVAPGRLDLVVDKHGIIVCGSRCTKSKMPWPPGSDR